MQLDFKFEAGHNKEYKVDGIQNSAVYAKGLIISQLLRFYYQILWKSYSKEENI